MAGIGNARRDASVLVLLSALSFSSVAFAQPVPNAPKQAPPSSGTIDPAKIDSEDDDPPEPLETSSKKPSSPEANAAIESGEGVVPPESEGPEADSSPPDLALAGKAKAQTLYDEAREQMDSGDFAGACPRLEESQRLDPAVSTEFWLADCYENINRFASAWELYMSVAAVAAEAGEEEREQIARDRAAAVEVKLSYVTLKLDGPRPPGLSLVHDGSALTPADLEVALPIDAGEHHLTLSAPGYQTFSLDYLIAVDEKSKFLNIPRLKSTPAPPPEVAPKRIPMRQIALVGAGTGIVTMGVGGLLGLVAKGKANQADCVDNICTAAGVETRESARAMGNTATVLMIVGGALTAAGATLYFLNPGAHDKTLALTPTLLGAALFGTW